MTTLENSFQQEKLDHERETRFNREVQVHEMELMDQISVVKKMMVSTAVDALSKLRLTHILFPSRTVNHSSCCF